MCQFRALTRRISDNDGLLIQLFVSTLKKGAFEWFSNLAKTSVTWDELEENLLNNFFNNVKEVTLTTLTSTTQDPGELVEHFITRWLALASRGKPKLETPEFVEMCMNNLLAKICTKLVGIDLYSFNHLMKICEDELVVKQREQEKTVARQLDGRVVK